MFSEEIPHQSIRSGQRTPGRSFEYLDGDLRRRGDGASFLDRFMVALNSKNPDQVVELYRPQGALVTAKRTIVGWKQIKAWYTQLFTQLPADVYFIKTGQAGTGNVRSMRWIATGRKESIFDPGLRIAARAGPGAGAFEIFQGVAYKKLVRTKPRVHTTYMLSVDLSDPDIDLMVTPAESLGKTTSAFMTHYGLQVAVNGDEWLSWRNPKGRAVSEGVQYSAPSFEPTVYISANNQVQVGGVPPAVIWDAISGSHTLVRNGRVNRKLSTCAKPEVYCKNLAPRTSLGLTRDNRLILIVVQGLQDSLREALTLKELATLNVELGVHNAISLDGGGSSTMAVDDYGIPKVVNSPSDGQERVVSNHLGIRARHLDQAGIPIIEAGNDTFGLLEGEIIYHFMSYKINQLRENFRK